MGRGVAGQSWRHVQLDEVTVMLRDADTWDRMAEWEEKNAA
jgi:hypothetical protein